MVERSPFRRVIRALEDDKTSDDNSDDAKIKGTALFVHQQWSNEEIVNEEDSEEDSENFPDHENLSPFKVEDGIVDRTHIEAEHWHCKEYAPQCQISQILMSFLFLHPFHITQVFQIYCIGLPTTRSTTRTTASRGATRATAHSTVANGVGSCHAGRTATRCEGITATTAQFGHRNDDGVVT